MLRRMTFAALTTAVVASLSATPAFAGNIALTGHDSDFHCNGSVGGNCAQELQLITFARAGATNSSLPVLAFDEASVAFGTGGDLTTDLTAMGIPFVAITSTAAINASIFDPTLYSAFVVASDYLCGGCDNNAGGTDTHFTDAIAAQGAAISN